MNPFGRVVGALALMAVGFGGLQAQAQHPVLPVIPEGRFNVTNFGALGDGRTLNTAALQKAIDTASAAGGGTVVVPEGRFLTGPLKLASSLRLRLERNATLALDNDMAHYPMRGSRYEDGFSASGVHDLEICGEGTIEGQGQVWWTTFRANKAVPHRPYLVKISHGQRIQVQGIHLQNSPMFHLVIQDGEEVTIRDITIRAPGNSPNTDGIDPSGWNYLITGCVIDTGDDNIAIKPTASRTPGNKSYTITNCKFLHGHGMSIGSGTAGGIEDVLVSNCVFENTDSAVRIKTNREKGGPLQKITYSDLTLRSVKNPIYINDYYPERTAPKDPASETAQPVTARTPINQDIVIRNLTARDCPTAGTIRGLPEMPVNGVLMTNVSIEAKSGMKVIYARNIQFVNSRIEVQSGERLTTYEAEIKGRP